MRNFERATTQTTRENKQKSGRNQSEIVAEEVRYTVDCNQGEYIEEQERGIGFSPKATTARANILSDSTLSSTAKLVYIILEEYAVDNTVIMYVSELARMTGKNTRTVQRALSALVERGIVERTQRFTTYSKMQIASEFRILGRD